MVTLPREAFDDYVKHGSNDISRTPRLRAVLGGPLMRTLCDDDYITNAARSRWPVYRELYEPYDADFCASARVADHRGLSLSLCLFHSRGGGSYERSQLDTIDQLLPHLRRAIEVRLAIETEAAQLTIGALGVVGYAAMVCDPRGRLIEISPAGEALLRAQEFLAVRGGILSAQDPRCVEQFDRAMHRAASPPTLLTSSASTVLLWDRGGAKSRAATIAPFPLELERNLGGAILIVLPSERRQPDPHLLEALGLSRAEASVALMTAEGLAPAELAALRGVGIETIRSQLKSLYVKLGVHNAVQLGARLRDLF